MRHGRRLVGGTAAALLMVTSLIGAAPSAAAAAVTPALTAAVTAKLLGSSQLSTADARPETRITVSRTSGRWAFGTAVALAPRQEDAHPTGSIFLARSESAGWRIAFDGEAAFGELAAESPLMTGQERSVLTTTPAPMYAGGDYRTGMALPFGVGQTWTLTSGPHGWGGSESPYSSVDLAGGDQVVRAARAGTAYTMCQGWIRVIHDRGYSTDYYHLWNSISVNGAGVGQGAVLGNTGTDVTCGGAAYGRHVHFGLRQNSAYVPIAGHDIGKWVLANGAAAYQGGARHGSAWAGAGAGLYNYGALGFNQGVVDANGGGVLTRRAGPGTGYGSLGSVADGATVTISCSANGTSHTGRYGTTALWNRLSDGSWVSDAYLSTGVNGPINGWC
ncbi:MULTISPECIES: peptidoglycan DD-metalloendopeptidase family protein [Micromonospora]|uniref:Peptidoglycan DD-metalloendopeptidase family protein n=1 Tax=Micromonospora zamorensis TaxID=709883 RepID=A0ABZ1P852_9ACTN|nr:MULTISPECIES: peptidoglycan DD-metalloendopeptidase family protein [Micromonospora]WTI18535.1 peptidoglycan DD-metalloendopeptidase family protein [Micromonospora zamorensis]SCG42185.1 LasA protease [Micromonospora zamorensis]